VEPERHVRAREEIATISGDTQEMGAVVRAGVDGNWRPRRSAHQFVLPGDTIGSLVQHGYWLAVGAVSDLEYGVIHAGDPARVRLSDPGGTGYQGRVEEVQRPGTVRRFSAAVSVEFPAREDLLRAGRSRTAAVTVHPAGPDDSLIAVPAAAIVRFTFGSAVFVPAGGNTFSVRWLLTGPPVGDYITVRQGLATGLAVVSGGLETLALAARDSLAVRERKTPRR
jgi:hypothetical protein